MEADAPVADQPHTGIEPLEPAVREPETDSGEDLRQTVTIPARVSGLAHTVVWVMLWLCRKHPRLTWKQIKRRYWGRRWTSPDGTSLTGPVMCR